MIPKWKKLEEIAYGYAVVSTHLTEINHLAAATEAKQMSEMYYKLADEAYVNA